MNFVDQVELTLISGKGGAGLIHFQREKYRPNGGPDGGDGGRGGSIIIKTDTNKQTLAHLTALHRIKAANGANGQTDLKSGKSATDINILVPLGTEIIQNGETVKDLSKLEEFTIVKGGRGGKGNWHFKSATNQAPRKAEPGEEGQKAIFTFKLKLIADIGLVGQPNAGKSSLLNALTRASSRVAAYPFTTLEPHLGVVKRDDWERVIADIPGIIEGAANGKGLGHDFLAHIERTSLLLICIAADSESPQQDYKVIERELGDYSPQLLTKPQLLLVTKADLLSQAKLKSLSKQFKTSFQKEPLTTSSVTNEGLKELINQLQKLV